MKSMQMIKTTSVSVAGAERAFKEHTHGLTKRILLLLNRTGVGLSGNDIKEVLDIDDDMLSFMLDKLVREGLIAPAVDPNAFASEQHA